MLTLAEMLTDYDRHLLIVIANRWDIDLPDTWDKKGAILTLSEGMLDPERVQAEWDRLEDRERGALQMLHAAKEHKMPLAQYARLFKTIRVMGEEERQRENPHLSPQGPAEILYYRGFVGLAYGKAVAGIQQFIYVPPDLATLFPVHRTRYDLTAPENVEILDEEDDDDLPDEPVETHLQKRADTALVDDLTTFLAFLQSEPVQREGRSIRDYDRQILENYLIGEMEAPRIALMVGLAMGLGLIADDKDGYLKPVAAKARQWLDLPRTTQMQSLITTWQDSFLFNELYYVPNLILEDGAWRNDPTLIRKVIYQFLTELPPEDWFSVGQFIHHVKQKEPDFQRPSANYNNWFIRDLETDEYLMGFEHWERVEGGVLAVTLTKVLYWLGLVDRGESELGEMLRLTAYGKAYLNQEGWPHANHPAKPLEVQPNGLIHASRTLSRYDRFQVARFTEWQEVGEPYIYELNANSLKKANQHGITAEHILTFLKRTTHDNLPAAVHQFLADWEELGGDAPLIISRVELLETATATILDNILNTPELRQYLGRRLNDQTILVQANHWQALMQALQARGLVVEKEHLD